jgi:hypothetical protein
VGATESAGIEVHSAQQVGDYQVTVLTAKDVQALAAWLEKESFHPLDAAAERIVADYIARQWCFAVARLHRTGTGMAVPRPLMATFDSPVAVFPMKLTALANSTTHVELCVVADQQAAADGFACVAADRFATVAESTGIHDATVSRHFAAEKTGIILGSPDVSALIWENCVVTRLTADLTPAKMDKDVYLKMQPLAAYRAEYYTSLSRRQIATAVLIGGLIPVAVLAGIFWRAGRRPSGREKRIVGWVAVAMLALPVVVAMALPVMEVRAGRYLNRMYTRRQERYLLSAAQTLSKEFVLAHMEKSEKVSSLPEALVEADKVSSWEIINPYTGQTIRAESSPGNYAVRTIKGKTWFCVYDIDGGESRVALSDAPPGSDAAPDRPSTTSVPGRDGPASRQSP